jgi:DNA-binding NarL/FixJ family response regulator
MSVVLPIDASATVWRDVGTMRARRPRGVLIAYEPWASLTDGERSVANLMAEGLTNREIAGERSHAGGQPPHFFA